MKSIFILAGAAALAVSGAAMADPGHGRGHGKGDQDRNWNDRHGKHDRDWNDRYGDHGRYASNCPPGLAKKHNGCMPPGQARKLARGQRWQNSYGTYYTYGRIPYDLRRRYDLNSRYHYYYNDGYLYAVDPRTMLIQQVISALRR